MVGADVLGGPRPRGRPHACSADVPVRAARRGRRALPAGASRSPVGAARAHGGHGAFVVGADVPGGPRPPGRPHARSVRVPMRAARRGRRALPAGASRPPAGAARAHGGHGAFVVGADVPGGPRPPGRPHARSVRVPMRAARRGRRALPAGASRPPAGAARAHGGHGAFVVGADVLGGPRPRGVPMRAAWTSPCAQRARPPARGAPRTSRPTSRAFRSPLP